MSFGLKSMLWLLCLAFCALASAATPAINYRALLVGVSEYPYLQGKDLKGPKNDVAAMRDLLQARGFKPGNIRVLADGVAQSDAMPTRGAIVKALEDLARTAKPNDYIVIMLGGHGAQLPVPAGHPAAAEEDDGLFEVFLPRDVQRWTGGTGAEAGDVQNYLPDHEFRALVDRVAATGAFVWVIVDACHSGTMVRSGSVLRQLSLQDLGVPQPVVDAAQQRATQKKATVTAQPAPLGDRRSAGRAVYFYAAQPHLTTPEEMLPSGDPKRVERGLFSYTVTRGLQSIANPISYDQFGRWIRAELAMSGFPTAVNPEFGGNQLDAQVLGTAPLPRPKEWPLAVNGDRLVVSAGLAQEVGAGSILAILPSVGAKEAETIGFARVDKAGPFESTVVPVAYRQRPAISLTLLREGRVARLVQPGVLLPLVVHADLAECASPCSFEPVVRQATARADQGADGIGVRWVRSAAASQLVLKARGRRLWFLPPRIEFKTYPEPEKYFSSVEAGPSSTAKGLADELDARLAVVGRATRLQRLASTLAQSGENPKLKVALFPAEKSQSGDQMTRRTGPEIRDMGVKRVGELVEFELTNQSRFQMDVIAFYMDSQFGICEIYPRDCRDRDSGKTGALSPGGQIQIPVKFTPGSLGLERVIIIANERDDKFHQPIDLSFLQQKKLQSGVVERSADSSGSGDLPSTAGMFVFTVDLRE